MLFGDFGPLLDLKRNQNHRQFTTTTYEIARLEPKCAQPIKSKYERVRNYPILKVKLHYVKVDGFS